MRLRTALLGVLAALASGCATQMSEDECAGADWFGLGERDGLYGEAGEKFDERAAQCGEYGLSADSEAYFTGRDRGLLTYCTPESGYDAGRNGRPYRGVCPADLEGAFVAEWEIGRRLFDLTQSHQSAVERYESALNGIESNRHNLRRARERVRDEGLSDEERSNLNRDIDRYRREIERLERDLTRMQADIDDAYGRLEDYREYLRRQR